MIGREAYAFNRFCISVGSSQHCAGPNLRSSQREVRTVQRRFHVFWPSKQIWNQHTSGNNSTSGCYKHSAQARNDIGRYDCSRLRTARATWLPIFGFYFIQQLETANRTPARYNPSNYSNLAPVQSSSDTGPSEIGATEEWNKLWKFQNTLGWKLEFALGEREDNPFCKANRLTLTSTFSD